MARIRTCKPEFYVDSTLGELGHVVRDFYRSTWNFFDDYGRAPLDPKSLAVSIYPYEKRMGPKKVSDMILELIQVGRFILYEIDGRHFLQIPNWHHQRIDRPSTERIKHPDNGNIINDIKDARIILDDYSMSPRSVGRYQVGRYQVSNIVEETSTVEMEILECWKEHHQIPKAQLTPGRQREIRARLKDGYDVEQIKLAIIGCRASKHHMGDNDRKTIYNELSKHILHKDKIDAHIVRGERVAEGWEKGRVG